VIVGIGSASGAIRNAILIDYDTHHQKITRQTVEKPSLKVGRETDAFKLGIHLAGASTGYVLVC
jgi:hypothetical protein